MMKRFFRYMAPLFLLPVLFSCQQEISFENGTGSNTAAGSLKSDAANECMPKTLGGIFTENTVLTSANFIQVTVNVTTPGTYSLSTDVVNGYSFSGTGSLDATGEQTVTLRANGKPATAGTNLFSLTFSGTTCVFPVTVVAAPSGPAAVFRLENSGTTCLDAVVSGTYTAGQALTAAHQAALKVNVTTAGSYSITSAANGMSFTGTGNFTTTGVQTVTLTGTGTPTNAGATPMPVTVGTSSCSFTVNVGGGGTTPPPTATYFWKFTAGNFTYQGSIDTEDAQLVRTTTPVMTITSFNFFGNSVTEDTLVQLLLTDLSGGILANETYTTNTTTSNAAGFQVFDQGVPLFQAEPSISGTNITVKVTAHNTILKTIEGTFSGTAQNGANALVPITNGQFKAKYK